MTVIQKRMICCGVGTSLEIVTWITGTRFRTEFTVEIWRTCFVAINTMRPGPTFHYIENTDISQEFTNYYFEN